MWQSISKQISDATGSEFNIIEHEVIDGGEINDCYMVSNGDQRYFIKKNSKSSLPMFLTEVQGLQQLALPHEVDVPKVIHVGTTKDCSFLVLNFLPTKPISNSTSLFSFGAQLAKHHLWGEQAEYGFDDDNYIGTTLQPNEWNRKWCTFFSEQRLGWQLQLAKEKGINLGNISNIVANAKSLLSNRQPRPSLLHGDLWNGNVSISVNGPIMYDPACYWGDHECDIAMTELFGGFSDSFYQGYESVNPLSEGYQDRKELYNLYHILNHCNMFGGDYLSHAQKIIYDLQLD
jgi:fructosamine-3-kinase